MQIHRSVTIDRVIAACERDENEGFCISCGDEAYGCEPDMRDGPCETCEEDKVYGAEELLLYVS